MKIIQGTRQNLTASMRHYMAMRLVFRSSILTEQEQKPKTLSKYASKESKLKH